MDKKYVYLLRKIEKFCKNNGLKYTFEDSVLNVEKGNKSFLAIITDFDCMQDFKDFIASC